MPVCPDCFMEYKETNRNTLNMNMNLQEIKEKKQLAETKIKQLLNDFKQETGLIIKSINIELLNISTPEKQDFIYNNVFLDISL